MNSLFLLKNLKNEEKRTNSQTKSLDLKSQLQEAKNIEEDPYFHLKKRIHKSKRLEEEIMQHRNKVNEESIKLKFE